MLILNYPIFFSKLLERYITEYFQYQIKSFFILNKIKFNFLVKIIFNYNVCLNIYDFDVYTLNIHQNI